MSIADIVDAQLVPNEMVDALDDLADVVMEILSELDNVSQDVDQRVLKESYDYTIDCDGEVCGLTSGDHGWQKTGIVLSELDRKNYNFDGNQD